MRKMISGVIRMIKHKYEMSKYDHFTRAVYLRKRGVQIGDDCHICVENIGGEPYLVKIGNHVGIAKGVEFVTHSSGWTFRHLTPDLERFGKIEIEDNCVIGANAIILPNVTIGRNSIVGAGAVVAKDVPPNSVVAGNPAQVVGSADDYYEKTKQIWEKQKPEGYLRELEPNKQYSGRYLHALKNKPEYQTLLRARLTRLFWGKEI